MATQQQLKLSSVHPTFFLIFVMMVASSVRISETTRTFTFRNDCNEKVWPAIFPGKYFGGGGFLLKPGHSAVFTAPVSWAGQIWGRTGCHFNKNGKGTCVTGCCGKSFKCKTSGKKPATLAEFTLASPDFYDVSLSDGFNLPMVITPINGKGNCSVAGCIGDLRSNCPSELALKNSKEKIVGCRSACDVFKTDEYCCKGVHGNAMTCQPTFYSKIFKKVCPRAYSYPYDDPSSIFTCRKAEYLITFCLSMQVFLACSGYHVAL